MTEAVTPREDDAGGLSGRLPPAPYHARSGLLADAQRPIASLTAIVRRNGSRKRGPYALRCIVEVASSDGVATATGTPLPQTGPRVRKGWRDSSAPQPRSLAQR